jgi:hypothetical protein
VKSAAAAVAAGNWEERYGRIAKCQLKNAEHAGTA